MHFTANTMWSFLFRLYSKRWCGDRHACQYNPGVANATSENTKLVWRLPHQIFKKWVLKISSHYARFFFIFYIFLPHQFQIASGAAAPIWPISITNNSRPHHSCPFQFHQGSKAKHNLFFYLKFWLSGYTTQCNQATYSDLHVAYVPIFRAQGTLGQPIGS